MIINSSSIRKNNYLKFQLREIKKAKILFKFEHQAEKYSLINLINIEDGK